MMPSELDLLRALDDEPRAPSTVDVQRAIASGRRRRRIRRTAGYASVAALTALAVTGASAAGGVFTRTPSHTAASSASSPEAQNMIPGTADWSAAAADPPTSCTLERLPAPDNAPMALVSGADPTGRYLVGRSYPKGGGYQAVIWHDGRADKVMLPGDLEELLQDVNSTGTAVGWSYVSGSEEADARPVPYVYRDGKVSKLPGVQHGSAYAINEAGAIAGDEADTTALVWPSATEQPIRLPVPDGTSAARARDIDEDGTVVGVLTVQQAQPSDIFFGSTVPYVWLPDGTHHRLAMPSHNGKQAVTANVFSVRNGWATGVVSTVSRTMKGTKASASPNTASADGAADSAAVWAVRWNVQTGEVRVFDELRFGADAVNAHGWQVGIDKQGRAVLLAGTATVVLPDLASQEADTLPTMASALSDDGRTIGGQSNDETGTIQAVVWRCQ